jgi:hypothetical protein
VIAVIAAFTITNNSNFFSFFIYFFLYYLMIAEGVLNNTVLYILTMLALAIIFIQKVYENDFQFALMTIALTATILTILGLCIRKYMNSITN